MPKWTAMLVRDVVDSASVTVEADTGPDPIDVEAVSPLEAAKLARHYQTKPGTTAAVFEVREVCPHGDLRYDNPVTIDLTPSS